jgi:hypothetical protein
MKLPELILVPIPIDSRRRLLDFGGGGRRHG